MSPPSEELVMKTAYAKVGWTVGLMSISVAALAGEPKTTPPQEPAGFVVGGVIGGLAAGPVGAVIGAGIGTWLGNRVHKAGEAKQAEAEVAMLQTDKQQLENRQGRADDRKGQPLGQQQGVDGSARSAVA